MGCIGWEREARKQVMECFAKVLGERQKAYIVVADKVVSR